jgi:arylsulfatase A-like enzyme
MQHGFDDYYGLPYSNDMWPLHPEVLHLPPEERLKRWPELPLIEGNETVNPAVTPTDQERLTTDYTERAVRFIGANRDRPFFLYLAHSMVHVPLYVSDKSRGKSGAGLFADVVMEVDWSVGEVLGALREHGLDRRTLVVFTSDNGPWLSYGDHAGSAGPLREGKGTVFDGGCRVPTVMWWPGTVPAGTRCSEPAMTIDILPTVARLAGAELPGHPIDGRDIWPLMVGEPGARSPHEAYYFYWGEELQAVRSGRWKLHFPHGFRTMDGQAPGSGGVPGSYRQESTGLALFDLEADPGESADVKIDHPDVVARLERLAESARAELGDSRTGAKGAGLRPAGRH